MERMDWFISFTLEVDDKVGLVKIEQLGRRKNQLVNHTLKVYNDCGREIFSIHRIKRNFKAFVFYYFLQRGTLEFLKFIRFIIFYNNFL